MFDQSFDLFRWTFFLLVVSWDHIREAICALIDLISTIVLHFILIGAGIWFPFLSLNLWWSLLTGIRQGKAKQTKDDAVQSWQARLVQNCFVVWADCWQEKSLVLAETCWHWTEEHCWSKSCEDHLWLEHLHGLGVWLGQE